MPSPESTDYRPLSPQGHDPVLLHETLDLLKPTGSETHVDCTTGRGGHSLAIAQKLNSTGQLLCLDADSRNLEFAHQRLNDPQKNIRFFHANFAELEEVLSTAGLTQVDGILADLGISTNQLFQSEYGLSFSQSMPLDMRLDPRLEKSAADLVNHLHESDLADVLYNLAQERYSRRIAKKIVEARRLSPIVSTGQLAELVRSAIGHRGGAPQKIDPATRTFLALRMAVNQEMQNLEAFLKIAPMLLKPDGRLVVISFQSMEDRLVKQAFRSLDESGRFQLLTKKPLCPTAEEIAANPRSRSAKLRALKRLTV
jgi:16S rRNA (cytosine1402-N4)-methyltransferase